MLKVREGVFKIIQIDSLLCSKTTLLPFLLTTQQKYGQIAGNCFNFFKTSLVYLVSLRFLPYSLSLRNSNSTLSLNILLAASFRVLFIPTHQRKIYGHTSALFPIHVMCCFISVRLSSQVFDKLRPVALCSYKSIFTTKFVSLKT